MTPIELSEIVSFFVGALSIIAFVAGVMGPRL